MITQKEVKKYLDYNPDTGLFKWKIRTGKRNKVGKITGRCIDYYGYRVIGLNKKRYKASRLAWLYIYGKFPIYNIDHINRIRDDDRIINLRDVNQTVNRINSRIRKDNKSGKIGVSWCKLRKKWRAQITINKKLIDLYYFENLDEAIKIRRKAEIKYGFNLINNL